MRKLITSVALCAFAFANGAYAAGLAPESFNKMYSLAHSGDIYGLREAIHRGLYIDSPNQNGNTGLCVAIYRGDQRAYNTFRAAGANPRHPCTSVIPAAQYNSFMSSGAVVASPNTVPALTYTPIHTGFLYSPRFWTYVGLGAIAIAALAFSGGGGGHKKSSPEPEPEIVDKSLAKLSGTYVVTNRTDEETGEKLPDEDLITTNVSGKDSSKYTITSDDGFSYKEDYADYFSQKNNYRALTNPLQQADRFLVSYKFSDGVLVKTSGQALGFVNLGEIGLAVYGWGKDGVLTKYDASSSFSVESTNAAYGIVAGNLATATLGGMGAIDVQADGDYYWSSAVGMYADTGALIRNKGTINGSSNGDGTAVGMMTMQVIDHHLEKKPSGYGEVVTRAVNDGTITMEGKNIVAMGGYMAEPVKGSRSKFDKATLVNNNKINIKSTGTKNELIGDKNTEEASGYRGAVGMRADAVTTATNMGQIALSGGSSSDSGGSGSGDSKEGNMAGMMVVHGGTIVNGYKDYISGKGSDFDPKGIIIVGGTDGIIDDRGNIDIKKIDPTPGYGMVSLAGGLLLKNNPVNNLINYGQIYVLSDGSSAIYVNHYSNVAMGNGSYIYLNRTGTEGKGQTVIENASDREISGTSSGDKIETRGKIEIINTPEEERSDNNPTLTKDVESYVFKGLFKHVYNYADIVFGDPNFMSESITRSEAIFLYDYDNFTGVLHNYGAIEWNSALSAYNETTREGYTNNYLLNGKNYYQETKGSEAGSLTVNTLLMYAKPTAIGSPEILPIDSILYVDGSDVGNTYSIVGKIEYTNNDTKYTKNEGSEEEPDYPYDYGGHPVLIEAEDLDKLTSSADLILHQVAKNTKDPHIDAGNDSEQIIAAIKATDVDEIISSGNIEVTDASTISSHQVHGIYVENTNTVEETIINNSGNISVTATPSANKDYFTIEAVVGNDSSLKTLTITNSGTLNAKGGIFARYYKYGDDYEDHTDGLGKPNSLMNYNIYNSGEINMSNISTNMWSSGIIVDGANDVHIENNGEIGGTAYSGIEVFRTSGEIYVENNSNITVTKNIWGGAIWVENRGDSTTSSNPGKTTIVNTGDIITTGKGIRANGGNITIDNYGNLTVTSDKDESAGIFAQSLLGGNTLINPIGTILINNHKDADINSTQRGIYVADGEDIKIINNGDITATKDGIYVVGKDKNVENNGTITAAEYGIYMDGSGNGLGDIINNGTITNSRVSSDNANIYAYYINSITNNGNLEVQGGKYGIYSLNESIYGKISNSGDIYGFVYQTYSGYGIWANDRRLISNSGNIYIEGSSYPLRDATGIYEISDYASGGDLYIENTGKIYNVAKGIQTEAENSATFHICNGGTWDTSSNSCTKAETVDDDHGVIEATTYGINVTTNGDTYVNNYGIISATNIGLDLTGNNIYLSNYEGGKIYGGESEDRDAINISATDSLEIINNGLIQGSEDDAISACVTNPDGLLKITNGTTGEIHSKYGIYLYDGEGNENEASVEITNEGKIKGEFTAIIAHSEKNITITNSNEISGEIAIRAQATGTSSDITIINSGDITGNIDVTGKDEIFVSNTGTIKYESGTALNIGKNNPSSDSCLIINNGEKGTIVGKNGILIKNESATIFNGANIEYESESDFDDDPRYPENSGGSTINGSSTESGSWAIKTDTTSYGLDIVNAANIGTYDNRPDYGIYTSHLTLNNVKGQYGTEESYTGHYYTFHGDGKIYGRTAAIYTTSDTNITNSGTIDGLDDAIHLNLTYAGEEDVNIVTNSGTISAYDGNAIYAAINASGGPNYLNILNESEGEISSTNGTAAYLSNNDGDIKIVNYGIIDSENGYGIQAKTTNDRNSDIIEIINGSNSNHNAIISGKNPIYIGEDNTADISIVNRGSITQTTNSDNAAITIKDGRDVSISNNSTGVISGYYDGTDYSPAINVTNVTGPVEIANTGTINGDINIDGSQISDYIQTSGEGTETTSAKIFIFDSNAPHGDINITGNMTVSKADDTDSNYEAAIQISSVPNNLPNVTYGTEGSDEPDRLDVYGLNSRGIFAFYANVTNYGSIALLGEGQRGLSLDNQGTITNMHIINLGPSSKGSAGLFAYNGAKAINKHIINVYGNNNSGMYATLPGSTATNTKSILLKTNSSSSALAGILVKEGASGTNDSGGTIDIGESIYDNITTNDKISSSTGIYVDDGTGYNDGTINIHGYHTAVSNMNKGMHAKGSESIVTNNSGGVINVYGHNNTGMYAGDGGKAINDGSINIQASSSYGMYADNGGTVSNYNLIKIQDTESQTSYGINVSNNSYGYNYGEIYDNRYASVAMDVNGAGSTVANFGTLYLRQNDTSTPDYPIYGMSASGGTSTAKSYADNYGTILLSNSKNGWAMKANGENSYARNYGYIQVSGAGSGNTWNNAFVSENNGQLINRGIVYMTADALLYKIGDYPADFSGKGMGQGFIYYYNHTLQNGRLSMYDSSVYTADYLPTDENIALIKRPAQIMGYATAIGKGYDNDKIEALAKSVLDSAADYNTKKTIIDGAYTRIQVMYLTDASEKNRILTNICAIAATNGISTSRCPASTPSGAPAANTMSLGAGKTLMLSSAPRALTATAPVTATSDTDTNEGEDNTLVAENEEDDLEFSTTDETPAPATRSRSARAVSLSGGSTFVNNGLVVSDEDIDFDEWTEDDESSVQVSRSGTFVARSLKGTVVATANIVTSETNENEYETEGSFIGDTEELTVESGSYLFSASLANTGGAVAGIRMTMKDFEDVKGAKGAADFLDENYNNGNRVDMFNRIKAASNQAAYEKVVNEELGLDFIPTLAKQNIEFVRDTSGQMTDSIFENIDSATRREFITGIDYYHHRNSSYEGVMSYDSDGMNVYGVYDEDLTADTSVGLGFAIGTNRSEYDDDSTARQTTAQVYVPVSFAPKEFSFVSMPRFGAGVGKYKRRVADDSTHQADLTTYYYGISNQARKKFEFGGIDVEPTAEFNVLGMYMDKIKERENLYVKSQNDVSVEGGLGLYIGKTVEFANSALLKLRLGGTYYRELADPYRNTKAGFVDADGTYEIKGYNAKHDRGVVSLKADYNFALFDLYIKASEYIESNTNFAIQAGMKYSF